MKYKNKVYLANGINEVIKDDDNVVLDEVLGERFIGCGFKKGTITINGTPGNALGAYLDGANIIVNGNGQDAVGDTMNDGKIVVHGSVGDTLGYAMRGGKIFVRDNICYRGGVHIKEYGEKSPLIVIGGKALCFLGEYMAGGTIIVLNKDNVKDPIGDYTGVGMYGGKILVKAEALDVILPKQIKYRIIKKEEKDDYIPYIKEYATLFAKDYEEIIEGKE